MLGNKKERDTYIDIACDLNDKKIINNETYEDIYDNYKWVEENEKSEKIDDDVEI